MIDLAKPKKDLRQQMLMFQLKTNDYDWKIISAYRYGVSCENGQPVVQCPYTNLTNTKKCVIEYKIKQVIKGENTTLMKL